MHLLMARGAEELESLFPGLLAGMVDAGVPILENRPDCIHFGAAGHVLGTQHRLQDEFTAYVPSRPQLEWQIRRRVLAIDNVDVVPANVSEPRFDVAAQRVTGVVLDDGTVGVVLMCAYIRLAKSPANGGRPVSASWSTQPSA